MNTRLHAPELIAELLTKRGAKLTGAQVFQQSRDWLLLFLDDGTHLQVSTDGVSLEVRVCRTPGDEVVKRP